MKNYSAPGHLNVGYGSDITIRELAELVIEIIGFKGDIVCDSSSPMVPPVN